MGKYKHGKPNEEIELQELQNVLAKSMMNQWYKAYVILLYWIGCRRSEPLEVTQKDVEEKDGSLFINIPAFKHGERGGPIELPLSLFGVAAIRQVWKATPQGICIFRFSSKTGYRIVKRLFPKKSPHWLRHNRLTKLRKKRDRGEITTDDIKSFTGIRTDATIEGYGMKTEKGIHKVAQVLE